LRILFELARRGHDVSLVGNVTSGDSSGVRAAPGFTSIEALTTTPDRDQPGVVVLNNPPTEDVWRRVCAKVRWPILLWAGNPVDQCWLDRARDGRVAGIVCVSEYHRELYRLRQGFESVEVVYSGVDLDLLERAVPSPSATGAIVFCSIPRRTKGFHNLLRAWPLVRAARPDARLRVIGSARMHDPGAEVGRTEILDRELEEEFPAFFDDPPDSLARAGIALVGCASATQVFAEIKAAAVVVVNCNWRGALETYCRAAVEAQAAATPVIGAARGSLREVVADGRTGILVEKEEAGLLAQAVVRLLRDEALRRRLGRAGPSWASRFADYRPLAADWEAVLMRARAGQKAPVRPQWSKDVIRRLGYGRIRASARNWIRGSGLERLLLRYVAR